MSGTHAELSPSSAPRWMTCPGSVKLNRGYQDFTSEAAAEGTLLHMISAVCLENDTSPLAHLGAHYTVDGYEFTLNMEQISAVQTYVEFVRKLVADTGGTLLVEQKLPIDWMTGEEGAKGTADAVILAGERLIVADAKFGRGVQVDAEQNDQLRMYAEAALREFEVVQDFTEVSTYIVQPRLGHTPSEHLTIEEMEAFIHDVREAADATRADDAPLVVSDKGCQWCRAKPTCPAIGAAVYAQVALSPSQAAASDLSEAMSRVDMIEKWCKAVRAEVESQLLAGKPIPGYKLVQGKRGNRAWSNPTEAETLMKETFRLKVEEMYDLKLISPTTAEKLSKEALIGPRQWKKLEALITQSEGGPSVAPESDKRPALVTSAAADAFDDVTSDDQPPV